MPATKVGIFGGTFDPIHLGHLILARDAVEKLGLSKMIFIPAAISPHKLDRAPRATPRQRLEMLGAAIVGEEQFEFDDCELGRPGPSFTIDTVQHLRKRCGPEVEFYYLIGEDNVAELHTWKSIADLRALVTFVVFRRRLTYDAPPLEMPSLERVVEMSSTEIRRRVAHGRSIRYLVPEAVARIIDAEGIYRPHPQGGAESSPPIS